MIYPWCLVNVSGVSPPRHVTYVLRMQTTRRVSPSRHKQDPSLNVLDSPQDLLLHNSALQVKRQLTNFALKILSTNFKLYGLGRSTCCEEELEGVAVPVSPEGCRTYALYLLPSWL